MLFGRDQGPYCEQFLCLANESVSRPTCFLVPTGYFPANLPSSTITRSSLTPLSAFPHLHISQQINGLSIYVRILSSDVPFSYSQFIATSQLAAHDVLSSVLGSCCTSSVFCNDLFVDHCIEICYETHEER